MDNDQKFVEIIVLLSKICELRNTRGRIFHSFDEVLKSLVESDFTIEDFARFLSKLHDRLIKYSAVFRVYAFRAIRHLLKNPTLVEAVYAQCIHFVVIESVESDHEYLHERMQGFRLIRRIIEVAPQNVHAGKLSNHSVRYFWNLTVADCCRFRAITGCRCIRKC